ncbi:polyprenol monophosphomannose synthase [Lipingzhangella sp. LS1_29]|uniref:Polyprenol monophosphomannose synthase n=1 Tax=Lipingzhangella rawalii TaxID=2055835 RepID=A0ABU2H0T2_9ACTN|nr:polyprenol monophosphomannose synthase [Lipingzhangella rawalii]MDS1268913.1 polyprenol monophosphomannose synthase [Lipingzhangella rawalii]
MSTPAALPPSWATSRLSVVIPTYNEAQNLPFLLDQLLALELPNLRVVVVDDGSPDGTGELAQKFADDHGGAGTSPVTVVHRRTKDGLGRAYVAGMSQALTDGAEFVAQMDADLSHPPRYLPQLLGTLLATGAGVVIGSRYVPGASLSGDWGPGRRLLSGWANAYVRTILELPIRDVTAGYKLWRRDALEAVDLETMASSGYSFQVEAHYRAYRRGQKLVEIPIHFEDRQQGHSKMDLGVQLESALRPFQLRRDIHRRRRAS